MGGAAPPMRLFRLDIEGVFEALRRYAEESLSKGAVAVVLIGSLARGDYTAFSDADVLIIVRDDGRRHIDRVIDFLDPRLPIDVEPRVYTVAELVKVASMCGRLIREVLLHGKLLAGDPSVIELLRGVHDRSCRDQPRYEEPLATVYVGERPGD